MMSKSNERVFPTQDEAIADAISMCAPGDIVTIHEATCIQTEEWERGGTCRCSPLVLRIGATA